MIVFYCILKSGVHLQTQDVSDPNLDALCSNGSKNRQVEITVLRLSSLIRWDVATLLRFLFAECCFQRVTVFLYFFVILVPSVLLFCSSVTLSN